MAENRRYENACEFLRKNQLRFSRQRMAVISELFFNNVHKKHFKVNELLKAIEENHKSVNISGASLTNILKGLCDSGHIRAVYANKPCYDIITTPHLHLYHESKDELTDIHDSAHIEYLYNNIKIPEGCSLNGINCVINVDSE